MTITAELRRLLHEDGTTLTVRTTTLIKKDGTTTEKLVLAIRTGRRKVCNIVADTIGQALHDLGDIADQDGDQS